MEIFFQSSVQPLCQSSLSFRRTNWPLLHLLGPSEGLTSGAGGVLLDGLALLDEGVLAGLGGGRAHEAALDGGGAQEARRGAHDLSLGEHCVGSGSMGVCVSGEGSIVSSAVVVGIAGERMQFGIEV